MKKNVLLFSIDIAHKFQQPLTKMRKLIVFLLFFSFSFHGNSQETRGSFKTKTRHSVTYGYLLQKPAVSKEKKPLLVFLHGSGERGSDLEKLKIHGPLKYLKTKLP